MANALAVVQIMQWW